MVPGVSVKGNSKCIGRNVIINVITWMRWSKASLPYHQCILIKDNPSVGMKRGQCSHHAPAVDRQTGPNSNYQLSSSLPAEQCECTRAEGYRAATSPCTSPAEAGLRHITLKALPFGEHRTHYDIYIRAFSRRFYPKRLSTVHTFTAKRQPAGCQQWGLGFLLRDTSSRN